MTSYNFFTYDLHTWNAWNNYKQRETVFFSFIFFRILEEMKIVLN